MSLDITLTALRPTAVWTENITHNLNTMADAVKVRDTTLYKVLWYPEELGLNTGKKILPFLMEGIEVILADPDRFKQYNPSNGWGDYNNLVEFVKSYIIACTEFPDGVIEISK